LSAAGPPARLYTSNRECRDRKRISLHAAHQKYSSGNAVAFSINGIGTTFYGSADPHDDGSYVVTKWVIFVYIPLAPLGSMRVWPISQDDTPWYKRDMGEKFHFEKVPLHMPHLLKGWGVTLGLFILLKMLG